MGIWSGYENARLIELSSIPIKRIHGIASVQLFGSDLHVISFRYRRLGDEIVKWPVVEIIRPAEIDIWAQINAMLQREVGADIASRLHH